MQQVRIRALSDQLDHSRPPASAGAYRETTSLDVEEVSMRGEVE
ncbi:hypothetical protein I553_2528 [Mycobacterium xenopi 4042]|uniref:Uncharacterized protein n=1 Tax=Mycobacterium xenopi 4042 TaxID=1299334 RepID=X8C7L9_MYCXE|nr:hypothetical protein I552_6846 [Mycobacterium xenopi 3993]EUA52342.1 hypothetical protein I553_2528 [Mycobacterium xenopi 4042]